MRALCALASYVPARLRAFFLINRRLTRLCLVLLQIPLCLSALCSTTHAKMQIFNFRRKAPFLGKFAPKNQNCQSKLKFGTQTNSNMQNSMMVFFFSIFDRKYIFWANLVQKIEIASLN